MKMEAKDNAGVHDNQTHKKLNHESNRQMTVHIASWLQQHNCECYAVRICKWEKEASGIAARRRELMKLKSIMQRESWCETIRHATARENL